MVDFAQNESRKARRTRINKQLSPKKWDRRKRSAPTPVKEAPPEGTRQKGIEEAIVDVEKEVVE